MIRDGILKDKAFFIFVLLGLLVPLFAKGYLLKVLIMIILWGIAAYGWDVISGHGGELSIGQAAFFAIGAYSVNIAYLSFGIPSLVGIFIGIIISAVVALVIGLIVLRLRGPYFSLCTLAFGEILRTLLIFFKGFTGGAVGLSFPYQEYSIISMQFVYDYPYYYLGFVMLIIAIITSTVIKNSTFGLKLAAIRNDCDAAESVGINLMLTKSMAFIIAAIITSMAGSFYAIFMNYIDPRTVCGFGLSVQILLIALVGGRRTKWGPLLGAAILIPITELTNTYFGHVRSGLSMLIYSIILIIVVLYASEGIVNVFSKRLSNSIKEEI